MKKPRLRQMRVAQGPKAQRQQSWHPDSGSQGVPLITAELILGSAGDPRRSQGVAPAPRSCSVPFLCTAPQVLCPVAQKAFRRTVPSSCGHPALAGEEGHSWGATETRPPGGATTLVHPTPPAREKPLCRRVVAPHSRVLLGKGGRSMGFRIWAM